MAEPSIPVDTEELFTVRRAMRELNRLLALLEDGEREKLVLMRGTKMVAVVLPVAAYAELLRHAPPEPVGRCGVPHPDDPSLVCGWAEDHGEALTRAGTGIAGGSGLAEHQWAVRPGHEVYDFITPTGAEGIVADA